MVWTLLLEAPTLRRTPQPLPPLGMSPPSPPSPPGYHPPHETYHIRILRPSKRLPFGSSKVDPVGTMEEGYKYSRQPLTQPASSSFPPFATYLSPFQNRNSLNLNYRPLSSFYSFSARLRSSLLCALVALYCSLANSLLLHRRSTYNRRTPPTRSPTSLHRPSPLPFHLSSPHTSPSILLPISGLTR